jgi:hypothetical protein
MNADKKQENLGFVLSAFIRVYRRPKALSRILFSRAGAHAGFGTHASAARASEMTGTSPLEAKTLYCIYHASEIRIVQTVVER